MAAMITVAGIDEALSNLGCWHKETIKSRLVHLVRDHYGQGNDAPETAPINSDELIKNLWETHDDPNAIKNKRRNLSSIKSSLNADLKRLYQSGQNPEGIILGPRNLFTMSNEAKDRILETFSTTFEAGGGANLDRITSVLEIVRDILSDPNGLPDSGSDGAPAKLEKLKDLVGSLSSQVGIGEGSVGEEGMPGSGTGADGLPLDADDPGGSTGEQGGSGPEKGLESGIPEDMEAIEEIEITGEPALDELEEVEEEVSLVEDVSGIDDEDVDLEEAEEEGFVSEDVSEIDDEETQPEEVIDEGADASGTGQQGNGFELGLPVDNLGQPFLEEGAGAGDQKERERLLAEEFDGYLGAMDRFYNQYLRIPQGSYVVGAEEPVGDELPKRTVELTPFYTGKFPVTNALFEIFIEKTGYRTSAEKVGYGTVYRGRYEKNQDAHTGRQSLIWQSAVTSKKVKGACWYQPMGPGSTLHNKRSHPVVQVSLEDALAFAAWTGKRLLTEREWEAAARTAEGWLYPWGKTWQKDSCNIEELREGDTTAVDRFVSQANELGIADTLGNVMEWTQERAAPSGDGKKGKQFFVSKGGGWISASPLCLFTRHLLEPSVHSNILGFRCAAS